MDLWTQTFGLAALIGSAVMAGRAARSIDVGSAVFLFGVYLKTLGQ